MTWKSLLGEVVVKAFRTLGRRSFLRAAPGIAFVAGLPAEDRDPDLPPVTNPRATDGDPVEPKWDEAMTITVGPSKADLVGSDDKVLQAAVDYAARLGGGTVRILPGTYNLRNAVYLQSGVRILGSGLDSVLVKTPSIKANLSEDSDWYDREITLDDAAGFQVGDGIVLRTRNPHNGSFDTYKRTIVARSGKRFKLDKMLVENFWLKGGATAARLFALFDGYRISDVVIENIALDGNRANNEFLNGNYVGCIFLRESSRIRMRQVTARNFNGDGISWQVCHDVRVEDCHSHDHAGFGLHPGSGSQRPLMRQNKLERNDIGLFFCWGVKWGLAEQNTIRDTKRFGISVGHKDTDNLIRRNDVRGSGQVGVLFRKERGQAFDPHRNRLEDNRIIDNGGDSGIGVDVQGETESIAISRNEIRETRQPMQRIGVRIGVNTKDVSLAENRIEGFSLAVSDLRKPT
jgi:hypothetical protein